MPWNIAFQIPDIAAKERKELSSSRKTEKGLEKVEDEGGR